MPVKLEEEGVPIASEIPVGGVLSNPQVDGMYSSILNEDKPLWILTRSICSLIYSI